MVPEQAAISSRNRSIVVAPIIVLATQPREAAKASAIVVGVMLCRWKLFDGDGSRANTTP